MNDKMNVGIVYSGAAGQAKLMLDLAGEMKNELDNAGRAILNCVEVNWQGQGATEVNSKISQLKTTFQSFQDAVTDYANFVTESSSKWEETDSRSASKAEQLKDTSTITGA